MKRWSKEFDDPYTTKLLHSFSVLFWNILQFGVQNVKCTLTVLSRY